jgi:hypothetical protein
MFGISKYIIAALVLVIVGMAVSGKLYFTWSQNEISILQQNSVKLETAVTLLQAENRKIIDNFKKQKILNEILNTKFRVSQKNVDTLRKVFRKHNLTNLSLKKPKLIESRINKATDKMFRDLENDTKTPNH